MVTQEISPGKFVDLDPIFQLLEVILNGSVLWIYERVPEDQLFIFQVVGGLIWKFSPTLGLWPNAPGGQAILVILELP